MSTEQKQHQKCPLCQCTQLKELPRYAHSCLTKCLRCGFVFSRKIPSAAELEAYYRQYSYGGHYYISPITLKRYREILQSFEKYRKLNRILDVGCGNGIFLSVARELGWESYGTEISQKAVEICQNHGLTVYAGTLEQVMDRLPEVDVVVSIEVVEHLSFPSEEVQRFSQVLRKEGLLYLTTPNFNSLTRRILRNKHTEIVYPEHLSYFTASTMKRMLKNNGFGTFRIETTGISLSRLKNAFTPATENPFTQNSTDERLRQSFEESRLLNLIKSSINSFLTITRMGNSLKIKAVRL